MGRKALPIREAKMGRTKNLCDLYSDLMDACGLKACSFYLVLSVLAVVGLYLMGYVGTYLYIAYITQRDYSQDLIQWRDQQLQRLDREYANLPQSDLPTTVITPPAPSTS